MNLFIGKVHEECFIFDFATHQPHETSIERHPHNSQLLQLIYINGNPIFHSISELNTSKLQPQVAFKLKSFLVAMTFRANIY